MYTVGEIESRRINGNDAKEDKKPDLCGLRIDFMCVAVWWGRYDSTGGRVKDIW